MPEATKAETAQRILQTLAQAGAWVSSARLGAGQGVSRMALCKQIRRLRARGYAIESAPRLGYRLTGRTDQVVPEEVTPLLRGAVIGRPYLYFPALESTNTYLRERAAALPEGATAVADAQEGGRGRLGRAWFSPAGVNLHLSVLLKPAVPPALAPQLSLVAAAAVLRALHAAGCSEAAVKWPNDIWWHGRKLAGILCEMEAEADLIHAVILGIGVNVNTTAFPPELRRTATSVAAALGHPVPRPALLAAILDQLDAEYAHWLRRGLSRTVRLLNAHSVLTSRTVAVTLPAEQVRGRVTGITAAGLLRLARPGGGTQELASGEVQLCRPAASPKGERR